MRNLDPVEKELDGWDINYEARHYIMQAVEKVVKDDDNEQAVKSLLKSLSKTKIRYVSTLSERLITTILLLKAWRLQVYLRL